MRNRRSFAFGLALLPLALLPASADAQSSQPAWAAFIGCWVNTDAPDREIQVCYVPVPDAPQAAERVVLRGDSVISRTRLAVSDGRQPVTADGCEGFEITQRSLDGARLYTQGEVTCGDVRQGTSALMTLSPHGELVRILAVVVGEQKTLVTERLAPVPLLFAPQSLRPQLEASQLRVRGARVAMMRTLDVTQIEAALQETDPVVVEAWMVEATRDTTGFRAPRQVLERLAAAGAPAGVIDMVVMLGNRDHFDVHAATEEEQITRMMRAGSAWNGWDARSCSMAAGPMLYTPELLYWHTWGFPSLYNPWLLNTNGCNSFALFQGFGFRNGFGGPWGPWFAPWDPRFGRGVAVVPVTGGSLSRSIPLGRVEKGRGYAPNRPGSAGAGGAAPRDAAGMVRQPSNANAQGGSGASSSGGSGGGSVSRPRTESSSGTGRTAQPRTPDKKP